MEKILNLFLYNNRLKFNEIEKSTKIRSNKLTYHLKKLIQKGVIIKEKDFYRLSETSEHIIPYLSEKKSILPVILIAIEKDKKIFMYKRYKRPYNEKLSLPGGRILLGETIPKATERIMKEKFNITCKFKKINSISLEHVKNKNKRIIHSFLLIFVTATTRDIINYVDVKENTMEIIPSDYKLIKKDLDKKADIKNIVSGI